MNRFLYAKSAGMSCLHFQNGKTHPDALSGLQPLNLRMIIYNLRSFQNLALRKLLLPGRRRYRLCEQFRCIACVYRTAVLDTDRFCCGFVIDFFNALTDTSANFFCLLSSSGLACSDRPDRLISDNRCLSLIRSYSKESNLNLLTDEIHGHALLSLL